MKKIDELKNIHKGRDIWVLGSGPSLNYIKNSFFDNKITIGVNRIGRFFECDYIIAKDIQGLKNVLKYKKKSTQLIFSKYHAGNPGSKKNLINEEHFIFNHPSKLNEEPDLSVIRKNSNKIVVSHSTITSAIHMAAFMGAANIIICGHDCGTINGDSTVKNYNKNFKERHKKGKDYINWLKKIELQTIFVNDAITKEYSCNIYSLNPFLNLNATGYSYLHSSKLFLPWTSLKSLLKNFLSRLKVKIIKIKNFFIYI